MHIYNNCFPEDVHTHTHPKKQLKAPWFPEEFTSTFFWRLFKPYWAHATAQEPLLTEAMGLIGDGEPLVAP